MERAKIRAVRWDSNRAHMNAADRVDGLNMSYTEISEPGLAALQPRAGHAVRSQARPSPGNSGSSPCNRLEPWPAWQCLARSKTLVPRETAAPPLRECVLGRLGNHTSVLFYDKTIRISRINSVASSCVRNPTDAHACPVCGAVSSSPPRRRQKLAVSFSLQTRSFVLSGFLSSPAPEELKDLTDFMHDAPSPLSGALCLRICWRGPSPTPKTLIPMKRQRSGSHGSSLSTFQAFRNKEAAYRGLSCDPRRCRRARSAPRRVPAGG